MRRPTRPFTVEPESRRKPAQGFASDEDRGRLIDEPAPEEVPSRDVHEDAPASGDHTPFAANGVVSTVASQTPLTTVSLGDPSSAFATQRPEPSPAALDESLEGERVPPSPVPAGASDDTRPENRDEPLTEPAPGHEIALAPRLHLQDGKAGSALWNVTRSTVPASFSLSGRPHHLTPTGFGVNAPAPRSVQHNRLRGRRKMAAWNDDYMLRIIAGQGHA